MQSLQFVDGAGDINIAIDGVVRFCLFHHPEMEPDYNVVIFDIQDGGQPIRPMLGDSCPPYALMADLARSPWLFEVFRSHDEHHAEARRMETNRKLRALQQARVELEITAGRVEKARLRASLRRRA
jgi:hypothetical protein